MDPWAAAEANAKIAGTFQSKATRESACVIDLSICYWQNPVLIYVAQILLQLCYKLS
jgi:hypothetical protein